jgi:hypothetical protein
MPLLPGAFFRDLDDYGTAARFHVVLIASVVAGTSCADDAGQFRFNDLFPIGRSSLVD